MGKYAGECKPSEAQMSQTLHMAKKGLFYDWPWTDSWELSSWNLLTDKSVLCAQGFESHYISLSRYFVQFPSWGLELQ